MTEVITPTVAETTPNQTPKRTMTVTRALARIKVLKEQLSKVVTPQPGKVPFQYVGMVLEKKINEPEILEFKARQQSEFDSFIGMMQELYLLKELVRRSNQKTQVVVDGQTMSVAEAITMKDTFDISRSFYEMLCRQYQSTVVKLEESEANLNEKIINMQKKQLESNMFEKGLDGKVSESSRELYESICEKIKAAETENNKHVMCCGFDILGFLKKEEKRLRAVSEDIDTILSESNAVTLIEF